MKRAEVMKYMRERMTYDQALAYIDEIPKFTEKHSNEHTKQFLHALGDPQDDFKIIHVAGSNGKGSVCMMIYHTLLTAGMRACGFFSPHLVDIRERFLVCDHKMSGKERFLQAFHQVMDCVKEQAAQGMSHPSYFEFLLLIGMLIFQAEGAEYVILETGLGGRMDATNCIDHPLMTIITSISLEHTEYLGETIAEIAEEKAGIIKEHVPVIFDASNGEAADVIRQHARRFSAKEYEIRPEMCRELRFKKKSIDFSLDNGYYEKTKLGIPFVAEYQVMNAALAVTALQIFQEQHIKEQGHKTIFTKKSIQDGMAGVYWPGRMEEVSPEIYFDGAHNADGIRVFLQTVQRINHAPALLLFSMVRDKDYREAVHLLAEYGLWDQIIVTHIPSERGVEPELLQKAFEEEHMQAAVITDYAAAWHEIQRRKRDGQYLFCTGSLYFIGALKDICMSER